MSIMRREVKDTKWSGSFRDKNKIFSDFFQNFFQNSLDWLYSRWDTAEGISELEYIDVESTDSEAWGEKKLKRV